jgi:hypothetical protein
MVLKNCGYFSLTKDGKKVALVIHHVRYLLNLQEVKDVLENKRNYALISEFVEVRNNEEKNQKTV